MNASQKLYPLPTSDITRNLTVLRMSQGLTQRALAAMIGTSQAHISDMESGRMEPSMSSLTRWAAALGVEIIVTLQPVKAVAP